MRLVGRVSVGAARPASRRRRRIDRSPVPLVRRASTVRVDARRGFDAARSPSSRVDRCRRGSPCVSCFHVVPPSVDLKMPPLVPLPGAVLPRPLPLLPQRRVDDVGVGRIDVDVLAAGVLVLEQHVLERLAAVGRAEDAALLVRAVGMAERGDEQAIRVLRIDRELRNLLRVAQAEMRPGLAGVGRFVDAVADGEVRARQPFAAADVDDVRIGRRDGDPADRSGRLVVEDRLPGAAGVGRLPDAAVDHADVEGVRLAAHGPRPPSSARRGADRCCAIASRRRGWGSPAPPAVPGSDTDIMAAARQTGGRRATTAR